jgi:hypothetical protein
MTLCAATVAIAALMVAAAVPTLAVAQSDSAATSEQIETGRMRMPNGAEVIYRIRLLPLASYPALPTAVVEQLQQRKCMVPQTYAARAPENVVHASLERQGSSDWAVLCSVNGGTTLYVFLQSQPGAPVALRHQRDTEWLGSEVLGAYGSAWGIARRGSLQIRQSRESGTKRIEADHDGIEDSFIDKSSTTHYFQDGSWITLENSN